MFVSLHNHRRSLNHCRSTHIINTDEATDMTVGRSSHRMHIIGSDIKSLKCIQYVWLCSHLCTDMVIVCGRFSVSQLTVINK